MVSVRREYDFDGKTIAKLLGLKGVIISADYSNRDNKLNISTVTREDE